MTVRSVLLDVFGESCLLTMLQPSPISRTLISSSRIPERYLSYMNWYLWVVTLSVPYFWAVCSKLRRLLVDWMMGLLPGMLSAARTSTENSTVTLQGHEQMRSEFLLDRFCCCASPLVASSVNEQAGGYGKDEIQVPSAGHCDVVLRGPSEAEHEGRDLDFDEINLVEGESSDLLGHPDSLALKQGEFCPSHR